MQIPVTPKPGQCSGPTIPGWSRTTEIINRPHYRLSVTKRPVPGDQYLISIDRYIDDFPEPTRIQLFLTQDEINLLLEAIR